MEASPRDRILEISRRLAELDRDTPEMSGLDWAHDHDWISTAEWEAAGEKSRRGAELQDLEVARLDALRREDPAGVEGAVSALVKALEELRGELARDQPEDFNLSLLPGLIGSLGAWLEGKPSPAWLAWTWRVAPGLAGERWRP